MPVFIGPEALLIGENGLKRLENVSYRVKELESDPISFHFFPRPLAVKQTFCQFFDALQFTP